MVSKGTTLLRGSQIEYILCTYMYMECERSVLDCGGQIPWNFVTLQFLFLLQVLLSWNLYFI
jgi:hypothetical protein